MCPLSPAVDTGRKRDRRAHGLACKDPVGSHATTAAATATTAASAISGHLVCIVFGFNWRVATTSRIARVHRRPRRVAGDEPMMLLGDVMLLSRCLARYSLGEHGGTDGNQGCSGKRDYRCLHFSGLLTLNDIQVGPSRTGDGAN